MHRKIVNGILWIDRTGAPWRDLPKRYGSWHTVSSHFYRWRKAGVWSRVLEALQTQANGEGKLDWEVHFSMARSFEPTNTPLAREKRGEDQALGRSRGGFSTKIHLRVEGHGKPLVILLTSGQQHDSTVFESLMHKGAVRRPGRGRARIRPKRLMADKAYSSNAIRHSLARRGIRATIPRRKDEIRPGPFNR